MIPTSPRRTAVLAAVAALAIGSAGPALGQSASGFSGFGGSSGGPIQIEASELEVRDKEGVAIFTGGVVVKQGDTTLETAKLVVHYVGGGSGNDAGKPPAGAAAAAPATGAASQEIDRLEASGKVLVTSKDQTASGNSATYDGKSEVLELVGDVVLTQGKNVVRGDRLVVEMQSGRARVLSNRNRVQMLLTPGDSTARPAAGKPAKPAAGN